MQAAPRVPEHVRHRIERPLPLGAGLQRNDALGHQSSACVVSPPPAVYGKDPLPAESTIGGNEVLA